MNQNLRIRRRDYNYQKAIRLRLIILSGIVALIHSAFTVDVTHAQTTSWASAADGNWSINGNWDNGLPNSSTDAIIAAVGTNYIVTLDSNQNTKSLSISSADATLSHGHFSTLFAESISVTGGGNYILEGGTIQAVDPNNIFDLSGFTLKQGTLSGMKIGQSLVVDQGMLGIRFTGGTSVDGDLNLANGSWLTMDQDFDLEGDLVLDGSFLNLVDDIAGRVLTVGAGKSMSLASSSVAIQTESRIDNLGIIETTDNSFSQIVSLGNGGKLINRSGGVIQSSTGGTLAIMLGDSSSIGFTNESGGTISAQNGSTIILGSTWTNQGLIAVDATSRLELGGSFATADIGNVNLTNGGTVSISGAWDNSATTSSSPYAFPVAPLDKGWVLQAGTIQGGYLNTTNLAFSSGTLDGVNVTGDLAANRISGFLELHGDTSIAGNIIVGNSTTLILSQDLTIRDQQVVDLGPGNILMPNGGVPYLLEFAEGSQLIGTGTMTVDAPSFASIAGLISPGHDGIGEFTLNGSWSLLGSAETLIEIGNAGTFDQITFNGSPGDQYLLGGTLNVELIDGWMLADGQSYAILPNLFGSVSGQFANFGQNDVVLSSNGFDLRILYDAGPGGDDVWLYTSVSSIPEPSASVALLMFVVFLPLIDRRQRSRNRQTIKAFAVKSLP